MKHIPKHQPDKVTCSYNFIRLSSLIKVSAALKLLNEMIQAIFTDWEYLKMQHHSH